MTLGEKEKTMDNKLLPCPFCGGRAKVTITNSQYIISCDNSRCIASEIKAVYIEYGSAVQAWNRRVTEK